MLCNYAFIWSSGILSILFLSSFESNKCHSKIIIVLMLQFI